MGLDALINSYGRPGRGPCKPLATGETPTRHGRDLGKRAIG